MPQNICGGLRTYGIPCVGPGNSWQQVPLPSEPFYWPSLLTNDDNNTGNDVKYKLLGEQYFINIYGENHDAYSQPKISKRINYIISMQ